MVSQKVYIYAFLFNTMAGSLTDLTRREFLRRTVVASAAVSAPKFIWAADQMTVTQHSRPLHVTTETPNLDEILKGVKGHVVMNEGVYSIDYDIVVNRGARLAIMPGTMVQFAPINWSYTGRINEKSSRPIHSGGMIVRGTLHAEGTEQNPITFTRTPFTELEIDILNDERMYGTDELKLKPPKNHPYTEGEIKILEGGDTRVCALDRWRGYKWRWKNILITGEIFSRIISRALCD